MAGEEGAGRRRRPRAAFMNDILDRLTLMIAERRAALAAGGETPGYVALQLRKGRLKLAEKLGEEAIETVIAASAQGDAELISESADLLFHLLILLGERGLGIGDVMHELERREGVSGLVEKAGRKK